MTNETVLIAGGYGVVGSQIARLLRKRYPEIEILLGGRSPRQGEELVEELGRAAVVRLDISAHNPLAGLERQPALVLGAVNDIDDNLMLDAIRAHIPYIDITRWTERMRGSILRAAMEDTSRAPVVFASSWMAATIGILVREMAAGFRQVDRIEVGILYAAKDKSGPNSVEYMDRMALPFEVREEGRAVMAYPFRKGIKTEFPGVGRFPLYRFDTPDQMTLPIVTGARSVAARIGFDDRTSGPLLSVLVRSGLWGLISGERFRKLRHGLMHNPGEGGAHRVRIDIEGEGANGAMRESWIVTDPQGQTHLTATGAMIQLDRLIRQGTPSAGIQVAERVTDIETARQIMNEEGISIDRLAQVEDAA